MVFNYWSLLDADKAKLWITNQVHIRVMISRTYICEIQNF